MQDDVRREREEILEQLDDWLEMPMVVLGFAWLGLMLYELLYDLSPFLESVGTVIWVVFIVEFTVKFAVSADKSSYLQRNWLTAVSLLLPAARVFRVFRYARALRAVRGARARSAAERGRPALRGRRLSDGRSTRRSGGPARRWRYSPDGLCPGPTQWPFRAGS